MSLANWLVAALTGLLVPVLTAVLTKARAAITTKASLAAVLVAVGGALTAVGSGNGNFEDIAGSIAAAFVLMASSYGHLWKPLKVVGPPDQPGVVDAATAGFGVGSNKPQGSPPAIAHGHLEP